MPLALTKFQLALCLSEAVSAWLLYLLWRSREHRVLKALLTAVALVPFLGPLFVFWIGIMPNRQDPVFQDRSRYRADVYERWRHVFETKDPVRKFRRWRELRREYKEEQP